MALMAITRKMGETLVALPGSPEDVAGARGISISESKRMLLLLWRQGLATRKKSGHHYIYEARQDVLDFIRYGLPPVQEKQEYTNPWLNLKYQHEGASA